MVEAGDGGPRRQSFAAQVAETLLESGEVGAGLRVARGDGAAGARVAALEVDFADAEAHDAALVFAVELIFPECGQVSVRARGARGVRSNVGTIDFQGGAKTLSRAVERHAGKPIAHRLQRCGGNNRRPVGDGVVGKTFGRVADQDLLLEVNAEPFRGVFGAGGEGKRARRNVAATAWPRARDGTAIPPVMPPHHNHSPSTHL